MLSAYTLVQGIGLSNRVSNLLMIACLRDVGTVQAFSRVELSKLHHRGQKVRLGKKSLDEIEATLKRYGLRLRRNGENKLNRLQDVFGSLKDVSVDYMQTTAVGELFARRPLSIKTYEDLAKSLKVGILSGTVVKGALGNQVLSVKTTERILEELKKHGVQIR